LSIKKATFDKVTFSVSILPPIPDLVKCAQAWLAIHAHKFPGGKSMVKEFITSLRTQGAIGQSARTFAGTSVGSAIVFFPIDAPDMGGLATLACLCTLASLGLIFEAWITRRVWVSVATFVGIATGIPLAALAAWYGWDAELSVLHVPGVSPLLQVPSFWILAWVIATVVGVLVGLPVRWVEHRIYYWLRR